MERGKGGVFGDEVRCCPRWLEAIKVGDPSVFGTRFEAEFGKGKEMRVDCETMEAEEEARRWRGRRCRC